MHVVVDRRPSTELSDMEIVAYLFQALRAQGMRTAKQVQAECQRLFPDLSDERQQACLGLLAQKLDTQGGR